MAESKTQTEQAQSSSGQRVVTIVTTKGEKRKVPFDGATWKELKATLEHGGKDINGETFSRYNLGNIKAVESVNRHTLEHPDASIPGGDFALFLMPYQSKSGGPAREKVKEFAKQDKVGVKAHFGNWTVKPEADLEGLLKTYKHGSSSSSSTPKKVKEKEKEKEDKKPTKIGEVVDSVRADAEAKASKKTTVADVLGLISGLTEADKITIYMKVGTELGFYVGTNKAQEKPDPKRDQEETERLMREMRTTAQGFTDVKRF